VDLVGGCYAGVACVVGGVLGVLRVVFGVLVGGGVGVCVAVWLGCFFFWSFFSRLWWCGLSSAETIDLLPLL